MPTADTEVAALAIDEPQDLAFRRVVAKWPGCLEAMSGAMVQQLMEEIHVRPRWCLIVSPTRTTAPMLEICRAMPTRP
jgi:hypothetical protein